MTRRQYPPREARGIPHEEAVRRGVCGAQRKNEDAPCVGPRDRNGLSICGRHCGCKNRIGYPCSQHGRHNGRCNNHGSESKLGPESGTWEHGGDSKYRAIFTGDVYEHYEAARNNERYLELREDLAVLDALFYQELKAAKLGQGGALMEELGRHWKAFQNAQPTKDATTSEAGRALRRVGELIAEGIARQAAQSHALEIQDRKRRTSETERKRISDQERTITQVEAMSFVAGMMALMRESISGEENEREILARFHGGAARLVREYVAGGAGGLPAA